MGGRLDSSLAAFRMKMKRVLRQEMKERTKVFGLVRIRPLKLASEETKREQELGEQGKGSVYMAAEL